MLRKFRRCLLYPVAFVIGLINMATGLDNPRNFLIMVFGYKPLALLNPDKYGKFRNWFDWTEFGWYYSRSIWFYSKCPIAKITKRDKILLRVRLSLTLPLEYLNAHLLYDWTDPMYKATVKRYFEFIMTSIKVGHCNHQRW